MIPILFDSNETEFDSNGLGRLRDCISCLVTEERNGIYECDFEYPINGANFDEIKLGRIIYCTHDYSGDGQPFDIVSYSKPIDGIVTFHAVHISYRLSKVVVNGKNINSLTSAFARFTNYGSPSNNGFTYTTDIISSGYVGAFDGIPKSVRSMLGGVDGSILDTYGGEYKFDKFNVNLLESRGSDRNITIRYGLNLTDYNDDTDYSESFNACVGYWSGSDADGNDVIVTTGLVYSGQTSYNARTEVAVIDLTDKFEDEPTVADLTSAAETYMTNNQTYLPSQNIDVSFINLRDTVEYQHLAPLYNCGLCDTIKVIYPRYNVEGRFKIVKTVYDVLLERFDEMELGNLSTTLSQALGVGSASGSTNGITGVGNVIEEYYTDNLTVSASNYVQGLTMDVSKSGYTPLGIVGFRIQNGSTNGANASYISVYRSEISGTTLTYALRNHTSNDAIIKVTFTVLYKATSSS